MVYLLGLLLMISIVFNIYLLRQTKTYKELTFQDSLTGLYNRRFFKKQLGNLRRLHLRHQVPFSLVLLDIDNFKQLNDTHGHLKGDEALELIAESIQDTIRNEDYVCRIGGEEFAILLPMTEAEDALQAADRVRNDIQNIDFVSSLTVSGGVVEYKGENAQAFIKKVDDLLYQAKESGRDKIIA